ncbi:MAG: thioredoxin [Candidatus Poribacteria bacterium]
MESKKPVIVTDETFEDEVEKSSIPVLLDCWAPWCGPCKMIAPTIEKLAEELYGKIKVAKLDVDENPKTAMKLEIMSIPTLLIYKEGKIVGKLVGAQPKSEIEKRLANI